MSNKQTLIEFLNSINSNIEFFIQYSNKKYTYKKISIPFILVALREYNDDLKKYNKKGEILSWGMVEVPNEIKNELNEDKILTPDEIVMPEIEKLVLESEIDDFVELSEEIIEEIFDEECCDEMEDENDEYEENESEEKEDLF